MLCLKKRRTYSFTQGEAPRLQARRNSTSLDRSAREERASSTAMVLTVTEDTPADMLAGSMDLLVQMPREQQPSSQRVTVQRSTPMMDLLVQIATANKLTASSYSLQAIGERGVVLPHQPNTPIGALDALQVRLLPKQATLQPRNRAARQTSQPFETTFRLQVHLPRNQLYVSRVSPKTSLAEILQQVCREKNLDRNKYELRHPANLNQRLELSLTLHDYQLQEVTLYPLAQQHSLGSALSSHDIMALQKQEDCRRQQARHSVFGFIFSKKSKDSPPAHPHSRSLSSSDSLASDETQRSSSPAQQQQQQQPQQQQQAVQAPQALPSRPHRKRRPAPKPPTAVQQPEPQQQKTGGGKEKQLVISHSRNSSDSSGYHEASVLSDNPADSVQSRPMPETLPRRSRLLEQAPAARKLAHTSHASKSLGNLAIAGSSQHLGMSRGISNSSLNSAGQRKKRAAPPPPTLAQPLPSVISTLERIQDSHESLTSDMDISKPPSDIDAPLASSSSNSSSASKASSDIACQIPVDVDAATVEPARVVDKETPVPRPRKAVRSVESASAANRTSCEINSFGLPSLTEDEREEIAQAIDSIDEAARAHEVDDEPDDVFVEEVPEAFRDDDVDKTEKEEAKALSCAVISTIPKCDHLEPLAELRQFNEEETPKKRTKVVRSQSDTSHFDLGPAEKHPRHLTSNGETFTFALNTNLGEAATRRIEASIAAGSGKTSPTETDILLQKVSDTLSHSLSPPSPPPTPENPNVEAPNFATPTHSVVEPATENSKSTEVPAEKETAEATRVSSERKESSSGSANERKVAAEDERADESSNNSNVTATSDYVSNAGEDLSIADWEYQIPAPPSAFRDDNQPAASTPPCNTQKQQQQTAPEPPSLKTTESTEPPAVDVVDAASPEPIAQPICEVTDDQQKKARVINELETKIHSNKPIVEPAKDESNAPKIAPVENNLSNFTITTYSSATKSVDIFEPMDEQIYSETRVLSTFATLTRGKGLGISEYAEDRICGTSTLKSAQSMERVAMPLVQDRVNLTERTQVFREKPVHRSKSYIVLSTSEKFQNKAQPTEQVKPQIHQKIPDESPKFESTSSPPKTFTSTTDLTSSGTQRDVTSQKQKFSQWRDNMLEKHKEPSRETQLASLQVLKSILPQLKKSEALDNNKVNKSPDDASTMKKPEREVRSDERDGSPITSPSTSEVQLRPKTRVQEPSKRYTYCGPPAVSLGSWSERPSLNVQIKNDTDYKFGAGKNSTSGAKTIVNLSASASEVNVGDATSNGRAQKEKDVESCVDTSSVNFRDLVKGFGQSDVRLRPKPLTTNRNPQHRHSEYLERPKPEAAPIAQNGSTESHRSTTTFGNLDHHRTETAPIKRYTSVVGITNNNNNNASVGNNNVARINNDASTTNFKIANGKPVVTFNNAAKEKPSVVPKPPTMPIITGVTLKSVNARPKSGPPAVETDPRDQLLDAIRNFGRDKLKSVG